MFKVRFGRNTAHRFASFNKIIDGKSRVTSVGNYCFALQIKSIKQFASNITIVYISGCKNNFAVKALFLHLPLHCELLHRCCLLTIRQNHFLNSTVQKFFQKRSNYVRGLGKTSKKQKIYICIIETKNSDSVTRKSLRNRLKDRFPFKLQKIFFEKMIDEVLVLNFDEWNEYFPQFYLSRLKPPLKS